MEITIACLYPDVLNLYGDKGNIVTLAYRLNKRGIEAKIKEYYNDDKIDFKNTDILYIGGGSDKDLEDICQRLKEQKDELKSYIDQGGCVLAVCSGYQMLGTTFEFEDKTLDGLGIIDIYTKHCKKMTGDIIIESDILDTKIVGFENRSAVTHTGDYTPLGKVVYSTHNSEGLTEGVVYKNIIGTYIHGPLLPKNPKLTDYIIKCALTKKYSEDIELLHFDDEFETKANEYIVNKYIK